MVESLDTFTAQFNPSRLRSWRRILITWLVVMFAALIMLLIVWFAFFTYVPPGWHLVIIAKEGAPLERGYVLAEHGQKGIQREVKAEGWHFVLPIVYTSEKHRNTVVPPGKVGIVTARGGKPLKPNQVLANEDEQGIQRRVLPPGTYRINTYGKNVELADATNIPPGFVGVLRRRLGKDGVGRFARTDDEKGILRKIFQPGTYYVNTKEFEVLRTEVGIFQSTFHYDRDPQKNTAITFISKGGFPISLDCTVEWEILPDDMPSLVAEYGSRRSIERKVIEVQAHAIGRDKGIDYGVQDFLEGSKREKFQQDFTNELTKIARNKDVTVHSAFIRNIVIPEAYLRPIRDKQIAAETELTNVAKQATAQSEAEVEREQRMVQQRLAEVQADTLRLVAGIDREVQNIGTRTQAQLDKLRAEYEAKIAALDAQRTRVIGGATTEVTKLKETARSNLYRLKMDVFQNDAEAFLRYSLAEKLNPKMIVRLFHSGPGTFWTNMDSKRLNLMLPANSAPQPATGAPESQNR